MKRFALLGLSAVLSLALSLPLAGCGGASGIEEGIPDDAAAPPPDFDPGGEAVPDMSGTGQ